MSLRAALLQIALGLGPIELDGGAGLQSFLNGPQDVFLNSDNNVEQADSLLCCAYNNVAICRVGQERYGDIVIIEDGCIERSFSALDGPPEPAPEIQFPSQ